MYPRLLSVVAVVAVLAGCQGPPPHLYVALLVPKDEVVQKFNADHTMIEIEDDDLLGVDPLNKIEFQRGKARTVKVKVMAVPPKIGQTYRGRVQVVLEPPAGIVVQPDVLVIDLIKDGPGNGNWVDGASCEVTLEVSADAKPGKLKLTVSPLDREGSSSSAKISFGVR